MLPVRYLEDLKTAPIDKVDFVATFQEVKPPAIRTLFPNPEERSLCLQSWKRRGLLSRL